MCEHPAGSATHQRWEALPDKAWLGRHLGVFRWVKWGGAGGQMGCCSTPRCRRRGGVSGPSPALRRREAAAPHLRAAASGLAGANLLLAHGLRYGRYRQQRYRRGLDGSASSNSNYQHMLRCTAQGCDDAGWGGMCCVVLRAWGRRRRLRRA